MAHSALYRAASLVVVRPGETAVGRFELPATYRL